MDNNFETNFYLFENFGHSLNSTAYRLQLKSNQDIKDAYKLARQAGLTMTARGAATTTLLSTAEDRNGFLRDE
jgi:hypothetical protein